jgi:GT2 family glycosyltransferase
VAGNRRRLPNQPAWLFADIAFTWDSPENLSGIVGHGTGFPCANMSVYGSPGQEVKLLDGVLLAAHSEVLRSCSISFDERFAFHFYDLDFCRQAEARGLRMGTWPISVIHESEGAFGTPAWRAGYAKYLEKWHS